MKRLFCILLVSCCWHFCFAAGDKNITLVTAAHASARVQYGAEYLSKALQATGYQVKLLTQANAPSGAAIVIGLLNDALTQKAIRTYKLSISQTPGKEGFTIAAANSHTVIGGTDASGAMYGCLELAARIRAAGALPAKLSFTDQPEMVLRGACVGIQKPTYLPGRMVYEYPYTPEVFPWLYDKALWIRYLDMLAENRMNSLYLWNGHPFASLVRLKEYPYAVEVDGATFKKNEDLYRFLTKEADRRGIWVIQMFYNIILSKPFAEKHGLVTQDRKRPITPLIADYTRKSIAAFVAKYPNVGLLVTLGEAMEGDDMDVKWFTETIIPGVKDGLQTLGKKTLPPIVLRGHDSNPQLLLKAALPLYSNLYVENKYNGEALTTYTPRGPWAAMHREISRLAAADIDNVHILANLEPFRYGATSFIQKCVQAMHTAHGANGLHLYPQASYWDWPYTADKTTPRLLQTDRDWIWYQAWARYAWNCHRDRAAEDLYWSGLLNKKYGTQAGKDILEAYEQTGEIAPKLLRRFGITNGNRQTLTLGMFMNQLINPKKWRVWPDLYDSDGPEGETLLQYADKEWQHMPHTGETPVQVIKEVVQHGELAAAAIDKAAASVQQNQAEFTRLKNDVYCYRALANYFVAKVQAALWVLQYQHSHNSDDLQKALPLLEQSVQYYRELAALTKDTYLYANSMQTAQRKVPIGGDDGKNKTWTELLPYYEAELQYFKQHLQTLAAPSGTYTQVNRPMLEPAAVTLLSPAQGHYQPASGARVFSDKDLHLAAVSATLKTLQGITCSMQQQQTSGTTLQFRNQQPVKVVVGFFESKDKNFLQEPDLETDAGADNYGQAAIRLRHAISIPSLPPVNVHTYYFAAGEHTLTLGKGACLVLGFMEGEQDTGSNNAAEGLDWLFEK